MMTLIELRHLIEEVDGEQDALRRRILDAAIWSIFGYTKGGDANNAWTNHWPRAPTDVTNGETMRAAMERCPNDWAGCARSWNVPEFATDVTAALELIEYWLPDHRWSLTNRAYQNGVYQGGKAGCHVQPPLSSGWTLNGYAWSPSMAVVVALIKIMESPRGGAVAKPEGIPGDPGREASTDGKVD